MFNHSRSSPPSLPLSLLRTLATHTDKEEDPDIDTDTRAPRRRRIL